MNSCAKKSQSIIIVLLSCVLALSLSACNGTSSSTEQQSDANPSVEDASPATTDFQGIVWEIASGWQETDDSEPEIRTWIHGQTDNPDGVLIATYRLYESMSNGDVSTARPNLDALSLFLLQDMHDSIDFDSLEIEQTNLLDKASAKNGASDSFLPAVIIQFNTKDSMPRRWFLLVADSTGITILGASAMTQDTKNDVVAMINSAKPSEDASKAYKSAMANVDLDSQYIRDFETLAHSNLEAYIDEGTEPTVWTFSGNELIDFGPLFNGVPTDVDAARKEFEESQKTNQDNTSMLSTLALLGEFEEKTIDGNGDDVIDIPCVGTPCLITFSHDGNRNFSVKLCDESGNSLDLLINTIGAYDGTVTTYFDYESASMLEIHADGNWSATFKPLSSMSQAENGTSFNGDDVVYLDVTELKKLHITHNGARNFQVKGTGFNTSKSLVNEIGEYDGTVIWTEPQSFFVVHADGDWTLSW